MTCDNDLDECSLGTHECANGMCSNVEGSYNCLCSPGFTGKFCDEDIDECNVADICNSGTCVNNRGSYSCECPPDYTGFNCSTPVEEDDREGENLVTIIASVISGFVLVVSLIIFITATITCFVRRRKRHDSYSPASFEKEDSPNEGSAERERLV